MGTSILKPTRHADVSRQGNGEQAGTVFCTRPDKQGPLLLHGHKPGRHASTQDEHRGEQSNDGFGQRVATRVCHGATAW